jgi:hypothetical protein
LTLNSELKNLQKSAATTLVEVERTDAALYAKLADIYLFWRKGRDEDGSYFEKKYKAANIKFKTFKNRENYNPLIHLVFGKGKIESTTASHWAASITAIDDEYVENKQTYEGRRNPSAQLAHWMKQAGGMLKVAGRREDEFEDIGDDIVAKSKAKKRKSLKTKDSRTEAEKVKDALRIMNKADAKASVRLPNHIAAAEGNLFVAVARKCENGKIEILSTTNDRTILADAALNAAEFDVSNAPSNLRLISEAIAVHSVPKDLNDLRKKLRETRTFVAEDGGELVRDLTPRLLIRPKKGNLLVSKARAEIGVVTRVVPNTPLIKSGKDTFLLGSDRYWVETTVRNEKMLAYMRSDYDWSLKRNKSEGTSSHKLELKNSITGDERALHFYPFSELADDSKGSAGSKRSAQVDYDDSKSFSADWEYEFSRNYIDEIVADFVSDWITDRKRHLLTKQHNKVMKISLRSKGWHISFDFRERNTKATRGLGFSLGAKGRVISHKGNKLEFWLTTKDFLYLMIGISGQQIIGKISVAGNSEVMCLKYKTELGVFETFVPACDKDGIRSSNHFIEYEG